MAVASQRHSTRSRTTRRRSTRSRALGGGGRRTNELAERLGVTPASASAMVKKLAELGLVDHVPYPGVELTD